MPWKQLVLIVTGAAIVVVVLLIGFWLGRNSVAIQDTRAVAKDDCYDVHSPDDVVRALQISPPAGQSFVVDSVLTVTVELQYRLASHDSAQLALWQSTDRDGSTRPLPRAIQSISKGEGSLTLTGPLRMYPSPGVELIAQISPSQATLEQAGLECFRPIWTQTIAVFNVTN